MNNKPWIALVLAVGAPLLTNTAQGQSPANPQDPSRRDTRPGTAVSNSARPGERLGALHRSSKLIGAAVKDAGGKKLGKVKDLAVDVADGRVIEMIIASGGVVGVGERITALPLSVVSVDASGDVTASTDLAKLNEAPAVDLDKWSESTHADQVKARHQYFVGANQPVSRNLERDGVSSPFHVERASRVMGLEVSNESGDKVGKVEDLVVDLAAGRLTQIVVSTGGFLGLGDELSSVPPAVFHYDVENGKLVMRATKDSLRAAPRFRAADWSTHSMPDRVSETYRAYGVKPYFEPGVAVDNSARNVRDRDSQRLTPVDQGNNEADLKTTVEIRRGLTSQDGLSVSARNVKVITLNGRVTLRGPVKTSQEKETVEGIAQRVAGVDRVDSELEVDSDIR